MHVEIHGRQDLLEDFRLHLHDQLEKAGYGQGPKISSMHGLVTDYIKGNLILSIRLAAESERDKATLIVKSEREIPDLENIWDSALIQCGKDVLQRLTSYAFNKERVKKEL